MTKFEVRRLRRRVARQRTPPKKNCKRDKPKLEAGLTAAEGHAACNYKLLCRGRGGATWQHFAFHFVAAVVPWNFPLFVWLQQAIIKIKDERSIRRRIWPAESLNRPASAAPSPLAVQSQWRVAMKYDVVHSTLLFHLFFSPFFVAFSLRL